MKRLTTNRLSFGKITKQEEDERGKKRNKWACPPQAQKLLPLLPVTAVAVSSVLPFQLSDEIRRDQTRPDVLDIPETKEMSSHWGEAELEEDPSFVLDRERRDPVDFNSTENQHVLPPLNCQTRNQDSWNVHLPEKTSYKHLLKYTYLDKRIILKLSAPKDVTIYITCPEYDTENLLHHLPPDKLFTYLPAVIYTAKIFKKYSEKTPVLRAIINLREILSCNYKLNLGCNDKIIENFTKVKQNSWTATVTLPLSALIGPIIQTWGETACCSNKAELYKDIMDCEKFVEEDADCDADAASCLQQFYQEYRTEINVENQHAFAVLYAMQKNVYKLIFKTESIRPQYCEINKRRMHSEEVVIQQIETFLSNNKNRDPKLLIIFTTYSPCLRREQKIIDLHNKNIHCCMIQLLKKSYEWKDKFGFNTSVAFRKYWGFTGPGFFDQVTFDSFEKSCPHVIQRYLKGPERMPFRLDPKLFKPIFKKSKIVLHKPEYEDLLSCGTYEAFYEEHMETGMKKIKSLALSPKDREKLQTVWTETLNMNSVRQITKEITPDFNKKTVQLFISDLKSVFGKETPLLLYNISSS